MANLVIKNNSQSDVSLTLDRGNNANWRMLNSSGILKVQTDWTDKKGNYYNVITLNYNTGNATIKGSVTAPSFIGALTGNAATADKWKTARTITLAGDLTGSVSVDGSSNVTLSAQVVDDSHNHIISNVDGLQSSLDSKINRSGDTMSGRLTVNGRISVPNTPTSWVGGMTLTNAAINITTQNSETSYHPILGVKTYSNHVVNFGGHVDQVGFYGFKSGRTANGTDWAFTFDVATGNVNHTHQIAAAGGFVGNASSATRLATTRSINGTSFNGTSDITTAKWGTDRTFTIGNTSKVVNGSTGVSWSLDEMGAAPRVGWNAVVKGKTWSRLCYVATGAGVVGSSYILNVGGTRNSVVYNDTYIIKTHHSSKAYITKISGSNYSIGLQIRVLSDSAGNSYVELYDNANSINASTTQVVYCRLVPLFAGDITKYTSFTDGTTLPTNFSVGDTLTTTNKKFQGSLAWDDIVSTPTSLSGYGITNAYTKAEMDSKVNVINDSINTRLIKSGDTMTGCLHIKGTAGSYNENIRLHPSSSDWSSIVFCGSDNTGNSGTSAKTWGIFTNGGNFTIGKNGSSTGATVYLHNNGSQWSTNQPFVAKSFSGSGANLTSLNASNISSGTIGTGRLPVIPASLGGTGKTNLKDSANTLINALDTGGTTPVDNDYYISQYVNGGTTTTTYHRRPMSALWSWINSKTIAKATKATQDASGQVITSTYDTITSVNGKIDEAKSYADTAAEKVKKDLLNGAGPAYDTLKELSDLIINNSDAIKTLENYSNEKFLPKAGGTMTGQLKTSFKGSVATGSYQAEATTLVNLLKEVCLSSGCMGSVNLTTAYKSIVAGWYNFLYIPHRSGGVNGSASGDNCNYGTLLLYGMTVGGAGAHWRISYGGGNIGTIQQVVDTNTWRGIQNNLTSTSTTDSLSAAMGKTLNESKMPYSGGRFTGPISFQASSLPSKSLKMVCGIDSFDSGGQMGWQSIESLTVGTATKALQDKNGVSLELNKYLAVAGGAMTGPIRYQGSKATYDMIKWIDNTSDTYGNGISIGGGGAVIIGGGESTTAAANVISSGGDEKLILCNDGAIDFYTNCQNGMDSAKHVTIDTSGNFSGNAATATKLITARTIKLTGDVNDVSATFDGTSNISLSLVVKDNSHNHSYIVSRGGVAAETGTNLPAVGGLSMTQAYSNGYPTTYGNVITMRGQGSGQLLIGWSGTSGADAPAYIRSKRDTSDAKWSEWRELITSANIGSQSVSYASSAGVTTRINVRDSSYTSSTAGEIWIVA